MSKLQTFSEEFFNCWKALQEEQSEKDLFQLNISWVKEQSEQIKVNITELKQSKLRHAPHFTSTDCKTLKNIARLEEHLSVLEEMVEMLRGQHVWKTEALMKLAGFFSLLKQIDSGMQTLAFERVEPVNFFDGCINSIAKQVSSWTEDYFLSVRPSVEAYAKQGDWLAVKGICHRIKELQKLDEDLNNIQD